MSHIYQISIANSPYILPASGKTLTSHHDEFAGGGAGSATVLAALQDKPQARPTGDPRMATNPARDLPAGLEIRGAMQPGYETILTPAALEFVVDLTRRFGDRVAALLAARATRQRE